jgi:hypothetical protein
VQGRRLQQGLGGGFGARFDTLCSLRAFTSPIGAPDECQDTVIRGMYNSGCTLDSGREKPTDEAKAKTSLTQPRGVTPRCRLSCSLLGSPHNSYSLSASIQDSLAVDVQFSPSPPHLSPFFSLRSSASLPSTTTFSPHQTCRSSPTACPSDPPTTPFSKSLATLQKTRFEWPTSKR